MRAPWIVAPLAGLALGLSCVLPRASFDPIGSGGNTTTGTTSTAMPALPRASGKQTFTTSAAVTGAPGTPTQRHLLHAAGTWWLLYLDSPGGSTGIYAASSPDFHMWTSGSKGAAIPLDLSSVALDGRLFGADTGAAGAVEVVHVTAAGKLSGPRQHARAVAQAGSGGAPALSFSKLDVGLVGTSIVDGATTVVTRATPPEIIDLSSAFSCDTDGGPMSSSCAFVFAQGDDGASSWSNANGQPQSLDTAFVEPSRSALLPLSAGSVWAIWQTQGGLSSAFTSGPPAPWSSVAIADVTGFSKHFPWAACAQHLSSASDVAHVVWWDGAFHHQMSQGGTWIRADQQDLAPLPGTDELFLACSAKRVFAFTITGTQHNVIQGAAWDSTSRSWSDWSTVFDDGVAATRCFLSGFDRLVEGQGIGLVWTDKCTMPSAGSLYATLVPVTDP